MVPEALDSLAPEERHHLYKPLRLRLIAGPDGSVEVNGALGDGLRYQNAVGRIPQGRFGEPWEIIEPALFLASQASSFVTGTTLVVDGGWTAV